MMYRFSEQARTNRPVTSCNGSEKNDDWRRTVAVPTRTPNPESERSSWIRKGQSQLRVSERLTKLTGFPLSGIEIADTGAVNA